MSILYPGDPGYAEAVERGAEREMSVMDNEIQRLRAQIRVEQSASEAQQERAEKAERDRDSLRAQKAEAEAGAAAMREALEYKANDCMTESTVITALRATGDTVRDELGLPEGSPIHLDDVIEMVKHAVSSDAGKTTLFTLAAYRNGLANLADTLRGATEGGDYSGIAEAVNRATELLACASAGRDLLERVKADDAATAAFRKCLQGLVDAIRHLEGDVPNSALCLGYYGDHMEIALPLLADERGKVTLEYIGLLEGKVERAEGLLKAVVGEVPLVHADSLPRSLLHLLDSIDAYLKEGESRA